MRGVSAAMRAIMAGRNWRVYSKLWLEDPDGLMRDVTAFQGANWFSLAAWNEDVDQPVASGTLTLIREDLDLGVSLAPAIGASPANRNGIGQYAPFLKEGRTFLLTTAVKAGGQVALAGDYFEVMRGRIDAVRQSADQNEVRLDFRDPSSELLDHELVKSQVFADNDVGMPIEDVIQASLDQEHGVGAWVVDVPVSPETIVRNITIEKGKHLERLRDLAFTIGWDLRWRYDAGGVGRLTFSKPLRGGARRVVFDSMTGNDNTLLQAHAGELGAVWAKHPSAAGDAQLSNANRLHNSGAVASLYYASGVPGETPNYDVVALVRRRTATQGSAGIVGRLDVALRTGYAAHYNDADGADRWELYRLDVGGTVLLGAYAEALVNDQDYTLQLSMDGAGITLHVNGVERVAAADATYNAIGRAGVWFRNAIAGGDAIGLHLDDVAAHAADTYFRKNEYTAIPRLDIGLADVRNWIRVGYLDVATGQRAFVDARDAASIAAYKTRFMELDFADDGNINTAEEAAALAASALNDLSTPFSDHDATTIPFYWPAQVNDVYEFEQNGIVYDSNQLFGVTGFAHSLGPDGGETTFVTKGKVVGAIKEWSRRARSVLGPDDESDVGVEELRLRNFREIRRSPSEVTYGWEPDINAIEQWLWLDTFDQPVTSDPWPTLASPNPIRLTAATNEYTIAIPPTGKITYGMIVPMDAEYQPGNAQRITVHPLDAVPTFAAFTHAPGASGLYRDAAFTVNDPGGFGGSLRVWVAKASPDDASPLGLPEGTFAIPACPAAVGPATVFVLAGGGAGNLLDEIRVHPGRGKKIYVEYVNALGISSGVTAFTLLSSGGPVDGDGTLVPGIITLATQFASTIKPVSVYSGLPVAGYLGEVALNLSDTPPKLYRWTGSAWTAATPTTDLSGTIATAQIADAAINAQKIADGAVATAKLANLAVDASKIANAAVGTVQLALLAVTAGILAANAVTTTKIADDAITTPKIVAGAITTNRLAAGAVTANEIAALTILAGNIAAGQITAAKIASHTITANEITALTITAAEIATGTITAAKIASHTITAAEIAALTITSAELSAGSVIAGKIAANAISANELQTDSVISGKIQAGAIVTSHMTANTINGDRIATNTLNANRIVSNTITATQIDATSIRAAVLITDSVTAAMIDVSVLSAITADIGTITAGKIQNAAGTQYLDLNASGSSGFLVHPKLTLRANGNAEFGGDVKLVEAVNVLQFYNAALTQTAKVSTYYLGPPIGQYGITIQAGNFAASITSTFTFHGLGATFIDDSGAHGFTLSADILGMWNPTAGLFRALEMGAANSGGAGYRMVRILN